MLFTHSFIPPLSGGRGDGGSTGELPPPVSASKSVEIAMPIAVRIDAMVIPCSRKCSNSLSQRLVFMKKPLDGLTNPTDLRPESCYVRGGGFEPRLYFKFEVGDLALPPFHSVSKLFLNFGVVRFCQFSSIPGQELLLLGFLVLGI